MSGGNRASRISRLQSQFVGRERHALSLASFQKAAARAPDQQDWSDLVVTKRRARRFPLIDNAHASPWVNSKGNTAIKLRRGPGNSRSVTSTRA